VALPGTTEGDVLIMDGAIAGLLGAVVGTVLGFASWFWYYPHLGIATAHRTDPLNLSWTTLVIGVILAVAPPSSPPPGPAAPSARCRRPVRAPGPGSH
jgi:hypothetical protein